MEVITEDKVILVEKKIAEMIILFDTTLCRIFLALLGMHNQNHILETNAAGDETMGRKGETSPLPPHKNFESSSQQKI